jgi:hypothetical protein
MRLFSKTDKRRDEKEEEKGRRREKEKREGEKIVCDVLIFEISDNHIS